MHLFKLRLLENVMASDFRIAWHSKCESSVQFNFTANVNMDPWFIKQPKSGGRVSDIGASSSTE
jgi:hypothetical protein